MHINSDLGHRQTLAQLSCRASRTMGKGSSSFSAAASDCGCYNHYCPFYFFFLLLLLNPAGDAVFATTVPRPYKYAALSILVEEQSQEWRTVFGKVTKYDASTSHCGPFMGQGCLFTQDRPWEPRLDNGYPNVIKDYTPTGEERWQLWYGDCVKGCGTQILLYAN